MQSFQDLTLPVRSSAALDQRLGLAQQNVRDQNSMPPSPKITAVRARQLFGCDVTGFGQRGVGFVGLLRLMGGVANSSAVLASPIEELVRGFPDLVRQPPVCLTQRAPGSDQKANLAGFGLSGPKRRSLSVCRRRRYRFTQPEFGEHSFCFLKIPDFDITVRAGDGEALTVWAPSQPPNSAGLLRKRKQ